MNQSHLCPSCSEPLTPRVTARGGVWVCAKGCGVCINSSVLRQNLEPLTASQTWQAAREASVKSARRCPSCQRELHTFRAHPDETGFDLDVCVPCMVLWFDEGELARLGGHLEARKRGRGAENVPKLEAHALFTEPSVDDHLDLLIEGIFSVLDPIYEKWGRWWG